MTRFSGLKMAKKRSNVIAHSVKTETAIETGCAKPRSLQRTSPIDYIVVEKICWGGGGGEKRALIDSVILLIVL